jgi:hypothetical protein
MRVAKTISITPRDSDGLQELLRANARSVGVTTEEDVVRIIHEYRAEKRASSEPSA